ncbi:MAG: LytR family transcriptional regulator, partial [Kribbellaceae bacterium]|nr:LytR family transcriptional regulator [Kribbellaceae bacterium]
MAPSRAQRAARARRAGPAPSGPRRTRPRRSTGIGALAIAVLGVLLPGTAYLVARRYKLGTVVTVLSLSLYGAAAYVGLRKREEAITWALDPSVLLWMIVGLSVVALGWIAVLVTSYKMLRPLTAGPAARSLGSLVIGVLC